MFANVLDTSTRDGIDIPHCSMAMVTSYPIMSFCHIGITLTRISMPPRAVNPRGGYRERGLLSPSLQSS